VKFVHCLFIFLTLGLTACASREHKPPKTTDTFTTLIQTDGTKQFSYTLAMEMPPRGGHGKGMGGKGPGGKGGPPHGGPDGGKGPGRHGPDDSGGPDDEHRFDDQLKHLTEEGLLAKLEDTAYCRNGYRQLQSQSKRGAMNITGECYDKATDAERTQFPNPEAKKVVEERLD